MRLAFALPIALILTGAVPAASVGVRSFPAAEPAAASSGDVPTLRVLVDGEWREWWRADRAPTRWTGPHPELMKAVKWRPAAPGVEWSEILLSGDGEAWRVKAVLVRMDPKQVRLKVVTSDGGAGRTGGWTIDQAPEDALVAFNAGQFTHERPWGWVVQDGKEIQPPGSGPLAPAVVVDTSGAVRFVEPAEIPALRGDPAVREAFQSYPALLMGDGRVPEALVRDGLGVDREHRDARLALGLLRDGRALVVLTRFAGLGETFERLPFGLTTPEIAALAGALGMQAGVLLDGGASGQLAIREQDALQRWRGIRRVPVGLLAQGGASSR